MSFIIAHPDALIEYTSKEAAVGAASVQLTQNHDWEQLVVYVVERAVVVKTPYSGGPPRAPRTA